jgi:hypothetical protein
MGLFDSLMALPGAVKDLPDALRWAENEAPGLVGETVAAALPESVSNAVAGALPTTQAGGESRKLSGRPGEWTGNEVYSAMVRYFPEVSARIASVRGYPVMTAQAWNVVAAAGVYAKDTPRYFSVVDVLRKGQVASKATDTPLMAAAKETAEDLGDAAGDIGGAVIVIALLAIGSFFVGGKRKGQK